jgi:hypothetical protein
MIRPEFHYIDPKQPTFNLAYVEQTVLRELGGLNTNLDGLRVDLIRVPFPNIFSPRADGRKFYDPQGVALKRSQLQIDINPNIGNTAEVWRGDLAAEVRGALKFLTEEHTNGRLYLDPEFTTHDQTIAWGLNDLFWHFPKTDYAGSLPQKASPGVSFKYWQDRNLRLAALLSQMGESRPSVVARMEQGGGIGEQLNTCMDSWLSICNLLQKEQFYDKTRYYLFDYSEEILNLARERTFRHKDKIEYLIANADSAHIFSQKEYPLMLDIHRCNFDDNLKTTEVARFSGDIYLVEARSYISKDAALGISQKFGMDTIKLEESARRLLTEGPESLKDTDGQEFWQDLSAALLFEERYRRIAEPTRFKVNPELDGFTIRDIFDGVSGDVRMHLSTVGVASFINTLPLLHPNGSMQIIDIFVPEREGYKGRHRGPFKVDQTQVNWVNAWIYKQAGERFGFEVELERFPDSKYSTSKVLVAKRSLGT